jgi:hypothetical protein
MNSSGCLMERQLGREKSAFFYRELSLKAMI